MNAFKPVDFDKDEDEVLEDLSSKLDIRIEKTEYDFDKERFDEALEHVKKEVELVKGGISELTHYAVDIEQKSPMMNALRTLEKDPFPDRLQVFLDLTKQDLGMKARNEFKDWFKGVFTLCKK